MAYRGDTTDPLEVIIQQRRGQRHVVGYVALGWLVSLGIKGGIALSGIYSPAAQSAPTQPSRVQTAATKAIVTSDGKMSAFAVERWLSTAPSSRQAPQDVRCRRALSGWDYICSYAIPGPTPTRFKIGVRVSANSVVQASPAHKYESILPSPSDAH